MMPAEKPVINLQMLQRLYDLQDEGDPHLVAQLIGMFLDAAPGRLTSLERAIAERRSPAVDSEAHSFKSSAANLGAHRLAECLGRIEKLGRQERAAEAAGELPAVRSELERACQRLRELAQAGPPA